MNRHRTRALILVACLTFLAGPIASADEPPWIGVRLSGDPDSEGVRIGRVFIDSPADAAGLRAGDAILTVGGQPVTRPEELIREIQTRSSGTWTSLTILRGEDELEVDVRLVSRPERMSDVRPRDGWIGIEAIELPGSLRRHFGAPERAGVMISAVVESSPAEAAGFDLGDVVYEVDGREVRSVAALMEAVAGGGVGNRREFRLMRSGAEIVVEAMIETEPAEPTSRDSR